MDDNLHKQMMFEAKHKSIGIAYLCWLLLGGFGAHRFYAGKTGSAIAQMVLLFSFIGWVVLIPWLLIDLALIPGMINEKNVEIINALNEDDPRGAESKQRLERIEEETIEPARLMEPKLDPKREKMLEELRKTGYKRDRRDNSHIYR